MTVERFSVLAKLALERGLVTREQLDECLREKAQTSRPLGAILLSKGYISDTDLEAIMSLLGPDEDQPVPAAGAGRGSPAPPPPPAAAVAPSRAVARPLPPVAPATTPSPAATPVPMKTTRPSVMFRYTPAPPPSPEMTPVAVTPVPAATLAAPLRSPSGAVAMPPAVRAPVPPAAPPVRVPAAAPGPQGPTSAVGGDLAKRLLDALAVLRGKTLGKFIVSEELGNGPNGRVLQAWDRETGDVVALKLFSPPSDAGVEFLEALRARTTGWAGLRHPSVVRLHEVARIEDTPSASIEYVESVRLDEFLAGKRPLETKTSHIFKAAGVRPSGRAQAANERGGIAPGRNLRRVVELMRDAASGLGHAHALGVVHGNLRPANLLIDGTGHAHVTDFGLRAAATGAGSEREEGACRAPARGNARRKGRVVTAADYVAPEEVCARVPTRRGDVYALGAMFYEALTGELPSATDGGAEARPPAPSAVNPRIHRHIDEVCLKAVERDPERRYADAREMAADLDRHLQGETVLAHPEDLLGYSQWYLRRRGSTVFGLAAAVLLAAGACFMLWHAETRKAARLAGLRQAALELERNGDLDGALAAWLEALAAEPTDLLSRQGRSQAESALAARKAAREATRTAPGAGGGASAGAAAGTTTGGATSPGVAATGAVDKPPVPPLPKPSSSVPPASAQLAGQAAPPLGAGGALEHGQDARAAEASAQAVLASFRERAALEAALSHARQALASGAAGEALVQLDLALSLVTAEVEELQPEARAKRLVDERFRRFRADLQLSLARAWAETGAREARTAIERERAADRAFEALASAASDGHPGWGRVATEPAWASLAGDPRFASLTAPAPAARTPEARLRAREERAALDRKAAAGHAALAAFLNGSRLFQSGRLEHRRVLSLDPDHAAARHELGYVRSGEAWIADAGAPAPRANEASKPEEERALAEYRSQAERLGRELSGEYLSLGRKLRGAGAAGEAERAWRMAVEYDPASAEARAELGQTPGDGGWLEPRDRVERERVLAAVEGSEAGQAPAGGDRLQEALGLAMLRRRGAGFEVHSTLPEPETVATARLTGALLAEFRLAFGMAQDAAVLPGPLHVVLLRNVDEQLLFVDRVMSVPAQERAAYRDRISAWSDEPPILEVRAEHESGAVHLGAHLLFLRLCGQSAKTPSLRDWLHEGTALYFCRRLQRGSTTYCVGPPAAGGAAAAPALDRQFPDPRLWPAAVRKAARQGGAGDLRVLYSRTLSGMDAGALLQAWSVVDFLLARHRGAFLRYLGRVGRGEDPERATSHCLGWTYEEMEDAWREYVWESY
ncbi:MAG: protein kinase [Planctomycetes bacterium]|nr:protein kinase [Planctomycetota bacterium]